MKRKHSSGNKRAWYRWLFKVIMIAVNVLVGCALLLGGVSLWIDPRIVVLPAYLGLAFPIFLFANVAFVFFWLFICKPWCLFSLVVMVLVYVPLKFSLAVNLSGQSSTASPLTVVSYNTMATGAFHKESGGHLNPVLDYIVRQDADIVCLQEFGVTNDPRWLRMSDVRKALGAYPYHHIEYFFNNDRRRVGTATFSKYPLVNKRNLHLQSQTNMALCADIVLPDDTLRLFNCHLESNKLTANDVEMQSDLVKDFDTKRATLYAEQVSRKLAKAYRLRATQARQLADEVQQSPHPVLLCGDFNDVPVSYAVHTVRGKRLNDAFVESGNGLGFTFEKNLMHVRIDYIMCDTTLCAADFHVDRQEGSDHYPIRCTIYPR